MQHELSFSPLSERERLEFETMIHDFVALEADKPADEASAVFASYDRPSGQWRLSFETQSALQAFHEHLRARLATLRVVGAPSNDGGDAGSPSRWAQS